MVAFTKEPYLWKPTSDEGLRLEERGAIEGENLLFGILYSLQRANLRLEPFHRLETRHLEGVEGLTTDEKLHLWFLSHEDFSEFIFFLEKF